MLARCSALFMNIELAWESFGPPVIQAMFSPHCREPSPQPKSWLTPGPCWKTPVRAMLEAQDAAMPARQPLQLSGGRPADARSELISACCVEPIETGGREIGTEVRVGAA